MTFKWTGLNIDILKIRWAEHVSCRVIAEELGCGKHAVIGKAHRLGLGVHKDPTAKPKPKRGRKAKPKPAGPSQPTEARDLPEEHIPAEQRKTLLELTDCTCRWPCGTPGTPKFYFCGAETKPGSSYCPRHHAICNVKVRPPSAVVALPRNVRV